jgi:uncharacterized membrane protein
MTELEAKLMRADFLEKLERAEKSLEALEVLDKYVDTSVALRFPTNEPILKITNRRTNEYWEVPITKEEYDTIMEINEEAEQNKG